MHNVAAANVVNLLQTGHVLCQKCAGICRGPSCSKNYLKTTRRPSHSLGRALRENSFEFRGKYRGAQRRHRRHDERDDRREGCQLSVTERVGSGQRAESEAIISISEARQKRVQYEIYALCYEQTDKSLAGHPYLHCVSYKKIYRQIIHQEGRRVNLGTSVALIFGNSSILSQTGNVTKSANSLSDPSTCAFSPFVVSVIEYQQ